MPRTLVFLAAFLLAAPAFAQAQGVALINLQGEWNGAGALQHQNGLTERIRCQALYASPTPDQLRQRLSCKSDSTDFSITSILQLSGNDLSGEWSETTRNARGNFRGRVGSGLIQGQVIGTGFSAAITIRFAGDRQNVGIRSAGTDMSNLDMVLTRARHGR